MSKKIPFYFTIDFEDFYFNNLRLLGHSSPTLQEKGLFKSYIKIKEIKKKYLQDKPITFFVTAIIANKYPDIIKSFTRYLRNKQDDDELIRSVKDEILLMLYNKRYLIRDS